MTIRESGNPLEKLIGFVSDRRRPRTAATSHNQERRQLPPTCTLLSHDTNNQIDALFAQLPENVKAAAYELLSEPHLLCQYAHHINEQGRVQDRFEVIKKGTNASLATYTIATHENDPTATFILKARYETSDGNGLFQPYIHEELPIPQEQPCTFLFEGSYKNPSVLTAHPTVSYDNSQTSEQPDANTAVPVKSEMYEPMFQHVLGQLNALTQLATN